MIKELKPTNSRKSFYGKAIVEETENWVILYSYYTPILVYDIHECEIYAVYNGVITKTTTAHIISFIETFIGCDTMVHISTFYNSVSDWYENAITYVDYKALEINGWSSVLW